MSVRGTKGTTHSKHAVLAKQLDEAVAHAALGVPLTVGLEVTKVTDMAFVVRWGTVGLAEWVV
jgi:uncharacterized membrane protein